MQNKGYTLIEMCLVLLLLASLLLLTPNLTSSSSILYLEMNRMIDLLKSRQWEAIQSRKEVTISLLGNTIVSNDVTYHFDARLNCTGYPFHFNGKGNVSLAQTITCKVNQKSKQLVIHLGSGNMYLR